MLDRRIIPRHNSRLFAKETVMTLEVDEEVEPKKSKTLDIEINLPVKDPPLNSKVSEHLEK